MQVFCVSSKYIPCIHAEHTNTANNINTNSNTNSKRNDELNRVDVYTHTHTYGEWGCFVMQVGDVCILSFERSTANNALSYNYINDKRASWMFAIHSHRIDVVQRTTYKTCSNSTQPNSTHTFTRKTLLIGASIQYINDYLFWNRRLSIGLHPLLCTSFSESIDETCTMN